VCESQGKYVKTQPGTIAISSDVKGFPDPPKICKILNLWLIGEISFYATMNKLLQPNVAYTELKHRDSRTHREFQACGFPATGNDSHEFLMNLLRTTLET
jgi:hypothetical protein